MFKSAASVSSLAYNFLLSFLLLFAYNGIFLQKLYAVTGSGWDFVSVNLIVFLLLFAACNLLLWPKTAKPLAAFFLMANAVCLYFMADYHIAIDKIMLLNALETDSAEAADLFNKKFFAFLLIGGILPAVFFCRLKIRFAPLRREFLLRLGLTAAGLAVAAAVIFPNYKYAAQFLRNNRSLKYQLLPVNYVGAVISAVKIVSRTHHEPVAVGRDAVFRPYWQNGKPVLMVLVVGETARAQNFSLGGYPRDTNRDLLPYAGDLFYFANTVSCGTSTAVSLPCMFSAAGRRDFKPGSEVYTENLLDIFARTGYRVLWRENNSGCKNNCNRVETETFCRNYACKDEILLKDFVARANALAGNALIVLHQQGSHGPAYYHRYPAAFERYAPACQTEDLSLCPQSEIINAYDNSIAYTSHILAETVRRLKELSDRYNVIMLYVSDHGESLGENGIYLHAAPYMIAPEEQTRIPMLVWLDPDNADALRIDRECLRKKNSRQLVARQRLSYFARPWRNQNFRIQSCARPHFRLPQKITPRLFSLPDENLYHKAGKEKQT